MSMDRCFGCGHLVDTDDDGECYIEHLSHVMPNGKPYFDYICYCEPCRDRLFAYCDRCGNHVGRDEMAVDREWCQVCVDAEEERRGTTQGLA